jgi:hypothetical protein
MTSIISIIVVIIIVLIKNTNGLNIYNKRTSTSISTPSKGGRISGERWFSNNMNNNDSGFEGYECKILSISSSTTTSSSLQDLTSSQYIPTSLSHLGDINASNDNDNSINSKKANFYLNVGKALDTIRRELPMVFATSNLDFSIFANSITVTDGNQNKIAMSRSLYAAAIKSVQMASAFSSIYPSMNLKKIEYIEDCTTIQCLVDVVLPDSVRVDGSAVWEGVFYFGLDTEGLISTHVFDRKISTLRPSSPISASSMPWLRAGPQWSQDLLTGRRIPGLVAACDSSIDCNNDN